MRYLPFFAAAALIFASLPAAAQSPSFNAAVRLRGSVQQLSGQSLVLKTTDGQSVTVALPANVTVARQVKLTLADLKPNDFLGVGSVRGQDGKLHAVSINVFPE